MTMKEPPGNRADSHRTRFVFWSHVICQAMHSEKMIFQVLFESVAHRAQITAKRFDADMLGHVSITRRAAYEATLTDATVIREFALVPLQMMLQSPTPLKLFLTDWTRETSIQNL